MASTISFHSGRSFRYVTGSRSAPKVTAKRFHGSGQCSDIDPSSSSSPTHPSSWYRLLYFNTRGAAEPIRYLLAIHKVPYQDVRYPIQASAKGFGVDEMYLNHQAEGRFRANLNKVPILQIVQQVPQSEEEEGQQQTKALGQPTTASGEKILAEIGQTHSILRFLDHQHGRTYQKYVSPLDRASIDAFVESIRDVKTAWYKAKKSRDSKKAFLKIDLQKWCHKLEASLPALDEHTSSSYSSESTPSPWLIGNELSLADIYLYSMLATPVSLMTGSSQSFFDGAAPESIRSAYQHCYRIRQSMDAVTKLPAVRQWEERRPDTFN